MTADFSRILVFIAVLLAFGQSNAEDFRTHEVKIKGAGIVEFEAPQSWGRKPEIERQDGIVQIRFGPWGTQREPVFVVDMVAAVAKEPTDDAKAKQMVEIEVENFKNIAVETEIPVSEMQGADALIYYFTLSEAQRKNYEYQYLTMALIRSGPLVVTAYFMSNDGAPDYGSDAMHLMTNLTYVPPEPKKKKKR